MNVLGIDIGGTQIKAGMVDDKGAIIASRSVTTPADLESFTSALREIMGWLRQVAGHPGGIGIGCKGIINPDSTLIEILPGTLHFLEGMRLADLLGLTDEVPVFADNDARVAMSGEMVWGAARGRQNALMFTLGTGVGGAVLANGQLLRGQTGVAGHLGHITIEPEGDVCICGNRGCLETVFSAHAIEGAARAAVHRGCDSTLTRLFAQQPQLITCRTICNAAFEGDAMAGYIVKRATAKLGAGIAGLLHVFDPEVVILGGHVIDAGAALLDPLREEVWRRSRGLLGRDVPIVEQEVADKSGIVGAAGLVLAPR